MSFHEYLVDRYNYLIRFKLWVWWQDTKLYWSSAQEREDRRNERRSWGA